MAGEHSQDTDYQRSRHLHGSQAPEHGVEGLARAGDSAGKLATDTAGGMNLTFAESLLLDLNLSRRGNAPVRQEALLSMQRTYGNRAVQRFMQLSVQRSTGSDEEVKRKEEERKEESERVETVATGREAAARTSDAAREGSSAIVEASQEGEQAHSATRAMLKDLHSTGMSQFYEHVAGHEEAAEALEGTTKSRVNEALEGNLGHEGSTGKMLNGANYVLQYLQGRAGGQSRGEAASGAVPGAYVNNMMPEYLFKNSPRVGAADTAVNLLNAGLNLIPGMPEEVTGVTQAAADATPSSFATNVASTYGRGIWNTGKGIVTGDFSGLKQQRQDIMHGKAGAPLQGYALAGELLKWDRDKFDDITDEMREGKWGTVPKLSLKMKDALVGGPSTLEQVAKIAEEKKEHEGAERRWLLDRNREELMKRYGDKGFSLMWQGTLPIPEDVHQIDEKRGMAQMQSAIDQREKGVDQQTRADMQEQREVVLRTLEAQIGKERVAEMIARGEFAL